jgi:uncharacterized protein (DUF433 family)
LTVVVPLREERRQVHEESGVAAYTEFHQTNQGSFRNMPRKQRKLLGRYMVADPEICHGKPTFLGTRIMVAQVLKQVAKGMSWDAITAEWLGTVTREAIAEAVVGPTNVLHARRRFL